jgi:cleavage and polyadenylation specificity factor subunit 2
VDAVLLSHSSLACLGAYSYAAEKLGLTCPVYATTPVHDLGQQAVLDLQNAQVESGEFTLFRYAA